jgi:hypothetical protein
VTKSFTAEDAEDAKENNSLTAKAAKNAKEKLIGDVTPKSAKTTPRFVSG